MKGSAFGQTGIKSSVLRSIAVLLALTPLVQAAPITPGIQHVIGKAWKDSNGGTNITENGFALDGDAAHYTIREIPTDNQTNAIRMKLTPTTFALFHVHPNGTLPWPSPHDQDIADTYHVLMYTISKSGVYRYDPATKKTVQVTINCYRFSGGGPY
jgi:hypothetical protein